MMGDDNGAALQITISLHGQALNLQAPEGMAPDVLRSILLRCADSIQATLTAGQVIAMLAARDRDRETLRRIGMKP